MKFNLLFGVIVAIAAAMYLNSIYKLSSTKTQVIVVMLMFYGTLLLIAVIRQRRQPQSTM